MKGLADENFSGPIVRALRELRWDIVAATEDHSGVGDREIFKIARRKGLILLTFDKDFGDLYRASPLAAPSGLILLRFRRPTSPKAQRRILEVLTAARRCEGKFCVVGPDKVRVHNARQSGVRQF